MRIGLVSVDYPPASTDGVARQRQVLADGLARLGHEVHVITLGPEQSTTHHGGVTVHRWPRGERINRFLPALPVLDRPFTDAQLLCEGVLSVSSAQALDIVDVPLWLAQPLVLVRHAPCPVVIWLQTTLLHLVELQARPCRPHETVLADVDRHVLSLAAGCIADSRSILADVVRLYATPWLPARTRVVHPGLPTAAVVPERSAPERPVEILVVGRLEQRKGTRMLLEALPRLLGAAPSVRVRVVGRDNSVADGFHRETGMTYPEWFARAHPDLLPRVDFEGYVDEAILAARYASADLLLHPALYESFGLTFLEAMRASLPTVAFHGGGGSEIFEAGERDGAVLCAPGSIEALVDAAMALVRQPERRVVLGRAARRAFEARFTSDRMAQATADVYAGVVTRGRGRVPNAVGPSRMFHVMEALQDRDAVSRIARTNAPILAELGAERPIMALFAAPGVRSETGRLRSARFGVGDTAIFHYWGFSRLERMMREFPGRKAIHYHNITPPRFFSARTPHYEMTWRGYAQLDRIAGDFDLVLGDSMYNLHAYAQHLTAAIPMLCVYPLVDADALRAAPWDEAQAEQVRRASDGPVWLFVGRFAPNKRQDQVMRAFDHFAGKACGRLLLVGDMTAVPAFVDELAALREHLRHGHRIDFIASVSDETLRACYRVADLFVCASEHEGFCLPLAEAMAFGVPTLALDRGAVGETLGGAGKLVRDWHPEQVADLACDVLGSAPCLASVVAAQHERLQAFSAGAVRERLSAAVRFLRDGIPSPLFVRPEPGRARLPEAPEPWP